MKTLNGLSGSKKAQGLSLNTIIIAIIVLIVLVVIVIIFTGYFGKIFTPSVKSCTAQGGECADQCGVGLLGNEIVSAECTTPKDGTPLRCCSKIPQEQFTPQQTIASCEKQGGKCYGAKTFSCTDTLPSGVSIDACCTATPPCPTFTVSGCGAHTKQTSPGPCSGSLVCCTI